MQSMVYETVGHLSVYPIICLPHCLLFAAEHCTGWRLIDSGGRSSSGEATWCVAANCTQQQM